MKANRRIILQKKSNCDCVVFNYLELCKDLHMSKWWYTHTEWNRLMRTKKFKRKYKFWDWEDVILAWSLYN